MQLALYDGTAAEPDGRQTRARAEAGRMEVWRGGRDPGGGSWKAGRRSRKRAMQTEDGGAGLRQGSYRALLRENRAFRRLWLAQVVSQLGDWFDLLAIVAIVMRYTGSAGAIAVVLVVRVLPAVVVGRLAGVLADRMVRR